MAESVELPGRLAILPFRNKVLLPGAFIRIRCTSHSSVKLVEQELWQREEKGLIGILPVRDAAEMTSMDSVLSQGVGSEIGERSSKVPVSTSDAHKVDGKNHPEVIHWHNRFNVEELSTRGPYCTAKISSLEMTKAEMEHVEQDPDFVALSRQFKATAMELISVLEQKQKTGGKIRVLLETLPLHKLADIFVASFEMSFEEQLSMLDSVDPKVRLSKATELVDRHLQSIRVAEKITQKVEGQLSKSQKEFLLRQQKASEEQELDLKAARERLDSDHYGLVKIKQRIIEYLAVRKLKPDARGPVLCFVGPPGVGKTSLASSIAAALGRKFVRISLGGVKDEADIRGHRRTYIGSMPGRLIDGLKRVGVCNPVMLLDEIDKTGSDVRGDPASALLEVLDPEQNKSFNDQAQPIPPPLLDRMEVIELPGYTAEEKLRIAMQHLIPRVLDQHGLSSEFLQIPEAMVKLVIQRYTREAGVRNLERNLAALARAAAVRVAEQEQAVSVSKDVHKLDSPLLENRLAEGAEMEMEVIPMGVNNHEISTAFRIASPLVVDEAMLEKILGPPRFDDREAADRVATPGVSVGLVWTTFGGEVQFVEATAMAGNGELHLTGQLGDVIKESAQIALTWVRARAADLKLAAGEGTNLLQGRDIHIHFPAGAVPKDGPSAGVTLVTALVSLFSQKSVRADTAMTGEMTLRGLVLPVGGIKDKILAAHRHGVKRVILPERNLKDLVEVPAAVLSSLEILLAKRMEDVLEHAFEGGSPWRQHSKL
ncbi:hypothetical protein COLO4_06710 [Corchorus olitorius]|uniref:Lon protease homolog n=1 Tax=Corchorus olitorius TaxID=93759 RepID=A0A1R3KM67_9ROSI|nr:hypothetical protein COLO4_06710 [Corchorus olitorius]